MVIIAQGEAVRIVGNCIQRAGELVLESLRRLFAPRGVPPQGIDILFLGRGGDQDLSHRDQPCRGRGNGPQARKTR